MNAKQSQKAFNWMKKELLNNKSEYIEYNEVNCTLLSENCMQALNMYNDDIFEIAHELVTQLQRSRLI